MSHNLHRSLSELADAGLRDADVSPLTARVAAERIRAIRRRRPALIAGSTAAALILGGTGVFAAVRVLDDDADREPFPDRPTTAVTQPADSPSASPSESPTPDAPPTEPAREPAAELAVADAAAVFPQCGALASRPYSDFNLSSNYDFSTDTATDVSVPVTATSLGIEQLTGTASNTRAVIVRDDVVVGASALDDTGGSTPHPFLVDHWQTVDLTAELRTTACQPGSVDEGRLPAGHYSVWAAVDVVITERTIPEGYPYPDSTDPLPQTSTASSKIGDIWIGEDGLSVPGPEVPAGWPAALAQQDALLPGRPGPAGAAIAWVTLTDDELFDASERVFSLGYDGNTIATLCQEYGVKLLMPEGHPSAGIGVIFASRADAEAFADLYPDPIVGVSDEGLICYVD